MTNSNSSLNSSSRLNSNSNLSLSPKEPFLVQDLVIALKDLYDAHQLKKLDNTLAKVGINLNGSLHLEIIPEAQLDWALEKMVLELSGLKVLPWYLKVNREGMLKMCFRKVHIFGEVYYMHASACRLLGDDVEIYITAKGGDVVWMKK